MYDQNGQQGQPAQPQDNNPYGQLPPNDNNSDSNNQDNNNSGINNDQPQSPPPQNDNPEPLTTPPASDIPATDDSSGDLLSIKQDALSALNPLIEHLDQSPEEKFKTTMMMIQASDNQALIKAAYEAAKQITDEKSRAQALLDVVNEINYFTQQNNQ